MAQFRDHFADDALHSLLKQHAGPNGSDCRCCSSDSNASPDISSTHAVTSEGDERSENAAGVSHSAAPQPIPSREPETTPATPTAHEKRHKACESFSRTGGCEMVNAEATDDGVRYRCTNCTQAPLLCRTCLLQTHAHTPLHKAQRWDAERKHWEDVSVASLGLVLHLGHEGTQCPNSRGRTPRKVTVVHEGGVSQLEVFFCECFSKELDGKVPESIQAIEAGFWPGSWIKVQTMFTIEVLKWHELLSREGQMSTDVFWRVLQRRTDGTGTEGVPVCWTFTRMRRETGSQPPPGPIQGIFDGGKRVAATQRVKEDWQCNAEGAEVRLHDCALSSLSAARYQHGAGLEDPCSLGSVSLGILLVCTEILADDKPVSSTPSTTRWTATFGAVKKTNRWTRMTCRSVTGRDILRTRTRSRNI